MAKIYCFNCGAPTPSNFFAAEEVLHVWCDECGHSYNVHDINGSFGWGDR